MGKPILEGRKIPVDADGTVIDMPFEVAGRSWRITCVSMGNPHCVTFDADPDKLEVEKIGPQFERHPFFPAAREHGVRPRGCADRLTMRVWERGSGETFACGTGACAAVVAAVLTGRAERVARPSIFAAATSRSSTARDGKRRMTGPSVEVFSATIDVPCLDLTRSDATGHEL